MRFLYTCTAQSKRTPLKTRTLLGMITPPNSNAVELYVPGDGKRTMIHNSCDDRLDIAMSRSPAILSLNAINIRPGLRRPSVKVSVGITPIEGL